MEKNFRIQIAGTETIVMEILHVLNETLVDELFEAAELLLRSIAVIIRNLK